MSRRNWIVLAASVGLWVTFHALITGYTVVQGAGHSAFSQRSALAAASTLLTFAGGVIGLMILESDARLRAFGYVAVAVATLTLHAALGALVYLVVLPYEPWAKDTFGPTARYFFVLNSWIIATWYLMVFAFHLIQRNAEQQRRLVEIESASRRSQLEMLRHQLNPHFLFNTLNSISSLVIDRRLDEAESTLMNLCRFLRHSLDADPLQNVPLGVEVDLAVQYLAIEQIRFPDRLQVDFDVPDDLKTLAVPPFLLQPLLENVIKHVVARTRERVQVRISAAQRDEDLVLEVANDGVRDEAGAKTHGIGLGNVRARLDLIYGAKASLDIDQAEPGVFRVAMRFPVAVMEEKSVARADR